MKPQKPDTNPRKRPTQARARGTVEALLIAAAQVLIQFGYEGTTTARVAARAGVSVGSLYQYFPNKEALVAGLIEREAAELVEAVRSSLRSRASSTLEDCMRGVIHATITAHRLDPRLHEILHEQVPRVGRLQTAKRANDALRMEIEKLLREQARDIEPPRDAGTMASVIEAVIDALAHKAVFDRGVLSAPIAAREALALIMGYLKLPQSVGEAYLRGR